MIEIDSFVKRKNIVTAFKAKTRYRSTVLKIYISWCGINVSLKVI